MSESYSGKENILEEDRLLRRLEHAPPDFIIKPDGTPSSSCFSLKRGEDGLSVDIERLTTYERSIQNPRRFRLFALRADYTSSLGLENVHDPVDGNNAHALIKGDIKKTTARKLAKNAVKINYPPEDA
ncbi:hypothetical protein IFO69_15070 [Echinicola sp. CAU 1574]|uniref:Uncharacterized protein n=1 Tax=Echinicola arenosa TaxID=2774144 RepID=A0ABR9AMP5_9BACT|nr:hypothetical protein [Echinicola arenosa]MBD8490077.1 hypothetical protein [Echinicola arenosa]